MQKSIEELQNDVCLKYRTAFYGCDLELKVGISLNIKDKLKPINGLRINPHGDTSGWYIWGGEWSDDPNFFVPLHGKHLAEWVPTVLPYLGLEPGWRFLIDDNYEDVWKDADLLNP